MAHINRLRLMADELNSVNSPVSEETLIVRILQTLPRADQTIANLTGRLVTEELRTKTHGVADPADVAFFASHPSRIQQQQMIQQYQSEANPARSRGYILLSKV